MDTIRQTRRTDAKQKCHKRRMEGQTRSIGMCRNLTYCLATAQVVMIIQAMVLTARVVEGGTEGTCQLPVILSCQEIISIFHCDYK
jgi:hypothetical protein